jgi:hypothetical protein
MSKRCPPGVICLENITLIIIIVIVIVVLFFFYKISNVKYVLNINETKNNNKSDGGGGSGLFARPGYTFSNIRDDVLLNPYTPPLRDDNVFQNYSNNSPYKVPINIQTQSFDSNYRQIGILTRVGSHKETILPLMGKPLIANRDKWNFYTLSENNNLLKLPVSLNGRGCMSDTGCNNLYTGDIIRVDGYNDSFKVTTYESNTLKYIPYI